MDKIRIGDNEYQPPFRELDDEEINEVWVMDAGNNYVKVESVIAALNELAQLRAERDALKARVEELDEVAAFWCFKCDVLARWFDAEQRRRPEWKDTTVQYDLRKFRDILGRFAASRRNTTPGGDE